MVFCVAANSFPFPGPHVIFIQRVEKEWHVKVLNQCSQGKGDVINLLISLILSYHTSFFWSLAHSFLLCTFCHLMLCLGIRLRLLFRLQKRVDFAQFIGILYFQSLRSASSVKCCHAHSLFHLLQYVCVVVRLKVVQAFAFHASYILVVQ